MLCDRRSGAMLSGLRFGSMASYSLPRRASPSSSTGLDFSWLLLDFEALDATLDARPGRVGERPFRSLWLVPPTDMLSPLCWMVIRCAASLGRPTATPLMVS